MMCYWSLDEISSHRTNINDERYARRYIQVISVCAYVCGHHFFLMVGWTST